MLPKTLELDCADQRRQGAEGFVYDLTVEGEHNYFANGILVHNCLVVDEAHLLTMEGRGDALECGVMRFTRQNPRARLILLSATMPNVEELGRWCTRLNGKPSRVIASAWRPTRLTVHWVPYSACGSYQADETSKRRAALSLLDQHRQDKWIVFVHSKKAGYRLLDALVEKGEKVEFHNADLERDRRLALEQRFRHGDLRVVIATSTLAYGINMPARRVCVVGVHRGLSEVDPIDVRQEVGRAGRVGLDPEGDAYVLLPLHGDRVDRLAQLQDRYGRVGRIESKLNDLDTLAFHLTAEVAEGDVVDEAGACAWHARSLASFQGKPLEEGGVALSAGNVLSRLDQVGILKRTGAAYEATMLGRVSSWLYFSPFDVADWRDNFRRLVEIDRTRDDDCLAWALGRVRTAFQASYLPREHEGDLGDLEWRLRAKGIERLRLPPAVLAFHGLLNGVTYRGIVSQQRQLAYDSDRIVQAVSMIDRYALRGLGSTFCTLLGVRVRYGCTWDEAALCEIPDVGAKRARALVKHGVKTIEDVLACRGAVTDALGSKTGAKVIRAAKGLAKRRRRGSRLHSD